MGSAYVPGILDRIEASPGKGRTLRLRGAGIVAVIVGGIVFAAILPLLPWLAVPRVVHVHGVLSLGPPHGTTLWNLPAGLEHHAGVLTVIAVGTVALAAMALLTDSVVTALPAACGSFYLLGQVFPWTPGFHYGVYRVGFWLATVAALAMAVGGALAIVGAATSANHRQTS